MQINATTSRQLKFHSVVKFSTLRHSSNYVKRNVARFEAIAAQIRLPREDRRHLKSECFNLRDGNVDCTSSGARASSVFSLSLGLLSFTSCPQIRNCTALFCARCSRSRTAEQRGKKNADQKGETDAKCKRLR